MPRSPRPSATTGPDAAALLEGLRKALAGPKPLTGADGLFSATAKGKQAAEAAVDQGYLAKRSETLPPKGRAKTGKEVVLGELTDKGREHVLEADSPKAVLEALLPAVQALAAPRPPGPDVEAFRHELRAATAACVKAIEDGFAKLHKSVEAAFGKLEQTVAKSMPPAGVGPGVDPGPVVSALQAALARVSSDGTTTTPAVPPPAPASVGPSLPPVAATPRPETPIVTDVEIPTDLLRRTLREAYDHLCLFAEFRDRMVEIPRLYHETVRRLPEITLTRFHRELEALSRERKIELHKLNEVHMAKERELAIERNDRLYYYVLWK